MSSPEKTAFVCSARCTERYNSTKDDVSEVTAVLEDRGYGILNIGCLGICSIVDLKPSNSIVNVNIYNADLGPNNQSMIAGRKPDGKIGFSKASPNN